MVACHEMIGLATQAQLPSKSLPVPLEGLFATTQYLVPAVTATGVGEGQSQ